MSKENREQIIETRISEMQRMVNADIYPPAPSTLMIEITNSCNHSCVFCDNAFSPRPLGFIDADLYQRIIKEGYDIGIRDLALYSTGESTLDPRLPEFTAMAKAQGYDYVYLTSNGSADFEVYKALFEAGLDSIKFSINAATRNSYKKTHGKDHFGKVTRNLRDIAEYRKKTGRPARILASFIYTRFTESEKELAKEIIGPYVDELVLLPSMVQGGLNFDIVADIRPEETNKQPAPGTAKPCYMLWSRAHVTWEGYLTICCVDYNNNLIIADLNKTHLQDAWHHPDFAKIRKRHLEQNLEGTLCYNCMYNVNQPFQPLNSFYSYEEDTEKKMRHRKRVTLLREQEDA